MSINSSIAGTQSGAALKGSDGITSARQSGLTRNKGAAADSPAYEPSDAGDISSAFHKRAPAIHVRDANFVETITVVPAVLLLAQRTFANLMAASNDPINKEEYGF